MKVVPVRLIGAFLLALIALSMRADAETGTFLLISDIHFDPFYDPALFPRLSTRPVADWGAILASAQPGGFNRRGTDSNYALLKSSLDDAQTRSPHPDFVLYPGDLLAHRWQARYDAVAPRSHRDDPQAYRAFTSATIAFLAREFQSRFAGTAVIPCLGNEDSFCGDYRIEPDGPFLSMFASTWAPLLGHEADRDAFRGTLSRGGYFTTKLPGLPRQRLIVLNTVLFSVNYDNACGSATQTPAIDQFRWLAETLRQARTAGERVWILMHVPPGINSYNSAESVTQGGPPVTFWQQELTSRFLELTGEHAAILSSGFAGHTHMDDFRVVPASGKAGLFLKIAPAISPIFGNNPGYQVYQYDRQTGAMENYQTYYLSNLSTNGQPTLPDRALWTLEYDFSTAYGADSLAARDVFRLVGRMQDDPAIREKYRLYYAVSAPGEITNRTFPTYRCAITHITPAEFLNCLTGSPKPRRPILFPDRRPGAGTPVR